ncbi:MAG: NADH-ubiquinone oxidoreductase-F iron-sulfur binding region domain-containing protein [Planctomycetota bacterium]
MTRSILLPETRPDGRETLADYRARGGYQALEKALGGSPEDVLAAVELSGLRGRGGAGFSAGKKWRFAAAAPGDTKHVVANGGEHEPGSEKDKFLVAHCPHAVLEGLMLCGLATGARRGWVYLIEDMDPQREAVEAALEELGEAGFGERWLAGFAFETSIHLAPTTYVAGEETAAIASINGQEAKPQQKPPYPAEAGVHGEPTTVNNVETLAHVPFIVREGAEAFSAIGTAESKGTMLMTLGDKFQNPGVYEVAYGITWRELFDGLGGGTKSGQPIRAFQPALSSGFLGREHLDVPIAWEAMAEHSSSPGCGGVRMLEEGDDVVAYLVEVAQFFMDEQCGQCPPCRMETNQFVHVLQGVADGKGPGFAEPIHKVANFARGKGRCSLIEMAAAPVLSGIELFKDVFEKRATGGGE